MYKDIIELHEKLNGMKIEHNFHEFLDGFRLYVGSLSIVQHKWCEKMEILDDDEVYRLSVDETINYIAKNLKKCNSILARLERSKNK